MIHPAKSQHFETVLGVDECCRWMIGRYAACDVYIEGKAESR